MQQGPPGECSERLVRECCGVPGREPELKGLDSGAPIRTCSGRAGLHHSGIAKLCFPSILVTLHKVCSRRTSSAADSSCHTGYVFPRYYSSSLKCTTASGSMSTQLPVGCRWCSADAQ